MQPPLRALGVRSMNHSPFSFDPFQVKGSMGMQMARLKLVAHRGFYGRSPFRRLQAHLSMSIYKSARQRFGPAPRPVCLTLMQA